MGSRTYQHINKHAKRMKEECAQNINVCQWKMRERWQELEVSRRQQGIQMISEEWGAGEAVRGCGGGVRQGKQAALGRPQRRNPGEQLGLS